MGIAIIGNARYGYCNHWEREIWVLQSLGTRDMGIANIGYAKRIDWFVAFGNAQYDGKSHGLIRERRMGVA